MEISQGSYSYDWDSIVCYMKLKWQEWNLNGETPTVLLEMESLYAVSKSITYWNKKEYFGHN